MIKKKLLGLFTAVALSLAAPAKAFDDSTQLLTVTNTAAAGSGVTCTLPAAAGFKHCVTKIRIDKYATAVLTASATPVSVTTTNLNGSPAFMFQADAAAQGTMQSQDHLFTPGFKSTTTNTDTTIVCPATTNVIWRVTTSYYLVF